VTNNKAYNNNKVGFIKIFIDILFVLTWHQFPPFPI